MLNTLHPTLWRTCRALANHERLTMLMVLDKQGEMTVTQMADARNRPISAVSEHLRILNARGVLKARRQGRHVHYSIGADPTIPEARKLVRAVMRTLTADRNGRTRAFKALTGFTHPRRIRIVYELHREPLAFVALSIRCKISRPALKRHLQKLRQRGLVQVSNGAYALAIPPDPLSKCLVDLSKLDLI